MSKYRFKTEKEFKKEGHWGEGTPKFWITVMNKYLGQDIPDSYNRICDEQEQLHYETWSFNPNDYVLKETAFVLPFKWCVKVDRHCQPEEVYKWRKMSWVDAGYICYGKSWDHRVHSNHTEITFEQFKQHVLKESPVVESPKEIDMKDIQEEAKKRFPIGCKFIPVGDTQTYTLIEDRFTYSINDKQIWAHDAHGTLYNNGKWATLVSSPESKEESIPEYIECTASKDTEPYFIKGNIYKVVKASPISSAELKCNILKDYEEHNILYTRLVDTDGTKLFKPSTKEAYEAQNASKQLAKKDLVEGEIYIYDGSQISTYPEGPCLGINEHHYIPNPKWIWSLPITHATEEQKASLRREIERNSKSDVMWPSDPIVEQRINTPSIKKETFIDNVQSVDVILRTKRKSIKF
jgi:hypothetical protein